MKKVLFFLLLIPALALAQFGHTGGGGASVTQMMAIYADSSAAHGWTAGANTHQIKPRGGKSVLIDSLFVSTYARFDGNVVMNTTAGEQVRLGTGSDAAPELSSAGDVNTGIRFPGGDKMQFVQNGLNSHTWRPYRYTQTYSDGDTLAFWLDGSEAIAKTNTALVVDPATYFYVKVGGVYRYVFSSSNMYPFLSDNYLLGIAGGKWKELWLSDNGYIGGKGQAATMTWGQQAVMTEQADSCGVLGMSGGNPFVALYSRTGNKLNFLGQRMPTYDAAAWDMWFSTGGAAGDTLWISIDGTNAAPLVFGAREAKH